MDCPDGYFKDSSVNRCILCHDTCSTCAGPIYNDTTCINCRFDLYRDLSTNRCVANCGENLFKNNFTMQCDNCYNSCLYCNSATANDCTECKIGYYMYNSECLINCPTDYLKVES